MSHTDDTTTATTATATCGCGGQAGACGCGGHHDKPAAPGGRHELGLKAAPADRAAGTTPASGGCGCGCGGH